MPQPKRYYFYPLQTFIPDPMRMRWSTMKGRMKPRAKPRTLLIKQRASLQQLLCGHCTQLFQVLIYIDVQLISYMNYNYNAIDE